MFANRTHIKSTPEDFGQKEQDANTALLSLDKGLRSANIGDQCEAIVRFPVLFERYPFPILINSAFMRLADAYRGGNNFIRLCILKVVQESSKHLEKILNIDDLSKRIYSVIHSNDPIARAITLRTLGSLAGIIADHSNIHHTIMVGLDSHDAVEVEAAIFAADHFAKQSRVFSESICEQLGTMIKRLSTPLDIKMQIIPILKHMHHNLYTAHKAREVCEMLLDSCPSEKFVQLTLHTMSVLSVEALVHAQQQIELLLGYIEKNVRQSVKLVAIRDLCLISTRAPQLWTSQYTTRLCAFLASTKCIQSVNGVLDVLTILSKTLAVQKLAIDKNDENYEVLHELCDHDSQLITSKAILLLTHLTIHAKSFEDASMLDDVILALHSAFLAEAQSTSSSNVSLKKCLHSVVLLYSSLPQLDAFLLEVIVHLCSSLQGTRQNMVAECLAAIGQHNTSLYLPLMPTILDIISAAVDKNSYDSSLMYLCTVVLQVAQLTMMPKHVHELLIGCAKSCDSYMSWKIARLAMRYCQFAVADIIVKDLTKKVSTEQYYSWLSGLQHICEGESMLADVTEQSAVEKSMEALDCYQRAISALRAACTQTSSLDFQTNYASARARLLRLHAQLVMSCSTFRKCPPPAVAAALATTNNQEVSRSGEVVQQLMKCAKEYASLQQTVTDLYRSSFDADHSSLRNINILRETCGLMNSCILAVLYNKPVKSDGMKMADADSGVRRLLQILQDVAGKLAEITDQSLTHHHVNTLSVAAVKLMKTSLGFPRYFFQKQQSTSIKLAISPQSSDPITTNCSAQLTLKVEGVIQHGQHPGLYRRVCRVNIYVESNLTTKASAPVDGKNEESGRNSLVQSTEPNNDYFSTNFLLSFAVAGRHNVRVTAAVVDENQSEWMTGPHTDFTVKSLDDSPQQSSSKMSH